MLPNVSSDDLGNPDQAGVYLVNGTHFEVETKHVETWRNSPKARFRTIRQTRINDDRSRVILGGLA